MLLLLEKQELDANTVAGVREDEDKKDAARYGYD
jgi:hypothetical protein